jgi:hypothetical protein
MFKRFTFVAAALAGMAALVTACSGGNPGGEPQEPGEGSAQVSVKGLSAHEIQSMTVTAQPANVTRPLTYSSDGGTFNGTLVLPTGTQTLTANGYAYAGSDAGTPDGGFEMDAGAQSLVLVATGNASVEIVANTTTAVNMRIYDQTPPRPQPDLAPLLLSLQSSSINTTVNQPVTLTVDAIDLDGDPLSYVWSSNCPSSVFGSPNASVTTWQSPEPGACTLSVAVSARGNTVSDSVSVVVFNGTPDGGSSGGAQVNGEYIPRPEVYSMAMFGGDVPYASVSRYSSTANFPAVRPGRDYSIAVYISFGTRLGVKATDLQATCGTVVREYDDCANTTSTSCHTNFRWTAPSSPATCRLTGSASNDGLADSFTSGIQVR